MSSSVDRVRVERVGSAFDLSAGYAPGGCFMERSGIGVAGVPFPETHPWLLDLNGPHGVDDLFADVELHGLDPEAPPPIVFGSIPFEPERAGRFLFPARTIRRDRDGETWMIELLREMGADVVYADPHVPELPEFELSAASLDEELGRCDLACVVTAHPEFDWQQVVAEAPLVIDFRGVTRGIEAGNLLRL